MAHNLNTDCNAFSDNFTAEEIAEHNAIIANGYDGMAVNVITVNEPTELEQSEAAFFAAF